MRVLNLKLLCMVFIASMLAGCHKKPGLLGSIPADTAVVITLCPDQLCNNLSGKDHGGSLTSGETIDKFFRYALPEVRTSVKTLITSSSIDRNMIALYSYQDTHGVDLLSMIKKSVYIVTFIVEDESLLVKELSATSDTSEEGFTAYKLKNSTLLIKEGQGWLISGNPQKAAATVSRHLAIAENASISTVKGLPDFLTKEKNLFNMAISMRDSDAPGWSRVSGKLSDDGKSMHFNASFINLYGKKVSLDDRLEDINAKLLDYAAPTDVFVAAVGLPADTDWESVTNYVSSLFPMKMSQRAMLAVVVTYLKRIDGTIFIAAGPAQMPLSGDAESLSAQQVSFFVSVELKKESVKVSMDDLKNLLNTFGIPATKTGDDEYVYTVPGLSPITLSIINGNCISLSNRQRNTAGNKSASDLLKGNSFAMWADIPTALAEKIYGGLGFKLIMTTDDEFNAEFNFNGSDLPILEQLALNIDK
ncbi:MAG: hypothetical protein NC127_02760 [Muribaculum sp.]|nr:hypothetical protein [Muribaculum sp.]